MKGILQDFDESFNLASKISQNQDKEQLISVIENWEYVHKNVRPVFSDLIESFGFYPYLKEKESLGTAALIRNEYHKSEYLKDDSNGNLTFHFEQKYLEEKISNKQNLLVSAPTSFGKSLLIEEFVARKTYNNIIIIQPTLALIDETRRKLKKYDDFYNIIVNTKQEVKENNLFILTSERVLDILPSVNTVDLFIVDEFYKISNKKKDERVSHLNIAFYKVMLKNPQLLLLTPNIDDINQEFIEKYHLEFFKTDYSLVNQKSEKIDSSAEDGAWSKNNEPDKRQRLFELLNELADKSEPTIVYVKSPSQAEELAKEYIKNLENVEEKRFPIFEWIDENISDQWQLKKYLRAGIGLHNGQYPRHIVNSQLEYFNNGNLNVIFATTSLIEGVNTIAKNIIIYDMHKGNPRITYFDFNNIKGRAGRMMKYYTGNIYYFDEPPKKIDETLDIPIVEQDEELQSEILVNLETKDIKEERKSDYQKLIKNLPDDLLEIFKANYFSVEKQTKLYEYLKQNRNILENLLWSSTPTQEKLLSSLEMINNNLDGNKGSEHTFLAGKCWQIINNNLQGAVKQQIEWNKGQEKYKDKREEEIINLSVSEILSFIKNKAKYEIPKKISVLESIVNYLSSGEKADYSSFIAILENEGVDEKLSILLDYGVPSSALKKLNNLPNENSLAYVKRNLKGFKLSEYEKNILEKAL